MHERIPGEYDGAPPSRRERVAYFGAWIAVAVLVAAALIFSFS